MDKNDKIIHGMYMGFIAFLCGFVIYISQEFQNYKVEAVKKGYAEWKVSESGYRILYVWKEIK